MLGSHNETLSTINFSSLNLNQPQEICRSGNKEKTEEEKARVSGREVKGREGNHRWTDKGARLE